MTACPRVPADALRAHLAALFGSVGMTEGNARDCATMVVDTDLWGVESHGTLRVPTYIARLEAGAIKANPQPSLRGGGRALQILDGDAGMGFLVAKAAMQRAIDAAGRYGIGAVAATNSNHFGAAALYAKQAADRGLIGIAMTNVMPNMAFPGGSGPITGNNPIAIAAPTDRGFAFLLDISMSTAAGGKLLLAARRNEPIPLDWATDDKGRFTDDASKALEGFLLPVGGHKGFGLSLAVDLLCGVISGGAFQFALKSMYAHPGEPSETCHMMIVVDPTVALSHAEYLKRMSAFCRTVKASPMRRDGGEMFLPGEIEERTRRERLESGIPLSPAVLEEIRDLAARLDVPPLAAQR